MASISGLDIEIPRSSKAARMWTKIHLYVFLGKCFPLCYKAMPLMREKLYIAFHAFFHVMASISGLDIEIPRSSKAARMWTKIHLYVFLGKCFPLCYKAMPLMREKLYIAFHAVMIQSRNSTNKA